MNIFMSIPHSTCTLGDISPGYFEYLPHLCFFSKMLSVLSAVNGKSHCGTTNLAVLHTFEIRIIVLT